MSYMNWMTETDRKSLVALITYPELSGKELSEIVGMSQSSLLRSRKRLIEGGVIFPVKIPSFSKLGLSVLFTGFGVMKEDVAREVPSRMDDIFFLSTEKGKGFGMGAARTYSDFYGLLVSLTSKFTKEDMKSFGFQAAPLDMMKIWRLADVGPLLAHDLSVDIWREDNPNEVLYTGSADLSKSEFEVFKAIIEHPDWSVYQIANEVGASRQKIYRLDRKFREEGLYVDKIIPDLKALGYEILIFAEWLMPSKRYDTILERITGRDMPWPLTLITSPIEGFMVAAFRNFRESRAIGERMKAMSFELSMESYRPNVLTISLQDASYPVNMDFRGILRTLARR